MILSVYLHKTLYLALTRFGTLDEVINRILDEGTNGKIDIMNKPICPPKKDGSLYQIKIVNKDYISLYETMGRSAKISLRRLLYWFVDNEIYNLLGWKVKSIDDFQQNVEKNTEIIGNLHKSISLLNTACLLMNDECKNKVKNIIKELLDVEKEVL